MLELTQGRNGPVATVCLSRDPAGIKPLCCAMTGGGPLFSELWTLVESSYSSPHLSPAGFLRIPLRFRLPTGDALSLEVAWQMFGYERIRFSRVHKREPAGAADLNHRHAALRQFPSQEHGSEWQFIL